jgi:ribose transport system permease protein
VTEATHGREAPIDQAPAARQRLARAMRGDAWTVGLIILFLALFAATKLLRPTYGLDALAVAALPVAFAAAGQAIAVISGGIDLSIGSVMALTNVVAAVLLVDASTELSVLVVLLVLVMGLVIGAVNGTLVVISRVPDIVVTLAMLFVWAGAALLVLGTPGGGSAPWIRELVTGNIGGLIPRGLILLLLLIGIIWIPLRRSRLGLSIYAIGSNQLAAFRSGVNVRGTKVAAYALTGFFAALGGLALTASTGIGTPIPGPYLLLSVAAIVLGGVSLAGGRGGLLGPIAGIYVLSLIRADLTFLGVEPAYSTVIQGAIMVAVVMAGAYLTLRRATA